MAGTEDTFNLTKEDVKTAASQTSKQHGGNIPADSDAALLQSIVDQADKSKADIIAERQANLPLPDDPPTASDFNSADASTVNVGSGGTSGAFSYGEGSLRDPATGDSAVRTDGEMNKTNVEGFGGGREALEGGLPNDAVTRDAKDKAGLVDTTNKDYGYPQKNDPADTSKLP